MIGVGYQQGPGRSRSRGIGSLVRSSITDPEDLAYYACFGAAEVALAESVRVTAARWIIEDAFKEAKQEVGLDEYEVRRWTGWYRHITLALRIHAFLAVIRFYATDADAKGGVEGGRTNPHDGASSARVGRLAQQIRPTT